MHIDASIVAAVALGIAAGSTISNLIERWPAKQPAARPTPRNAVPVSKNRQETQRKECQHPTLYREGSLAWFCTRCLAPVHDTQAYAKTL